MNYLYEEAKLSTEEIAEIYRNMEARGLSHGFCQACSEDMKPEQARKSSTGLVMCRPCYPVSQGFLDKNPQNSFGSICNLLRQARMVPAFKTSP